METKKLEEFRQILLNEKKSLLQQAAHTIKNEIELDPDDLADESDLASVMSYQNINLRLRGRERKLIDKLDHALKRIDADEFGECVMCGEDISHKRLTARPVTTMCIACKEDQERRERHFAE